MSRKRRTRAQKARAAEHRQKQLTQIVNRLTETSEVTKAETEPKLKKQPAARPISETEPIQDFRRRDLRTSLVILGSLIALQIGLWLLFRFTTIDERLYDWIKF